jgi:hypothetical protein
MFATVFGGIPLGESGEQRGAESPDESLAGVAGDGFIAKLFAALRVGLGVQTRDNESKQQDQQGRLGR